MAQVKGETVEDGQRDLITRGQLASTTEATKWPALALAGQLDESLRNILKWVRILKTVVTRSDRPTMNRNQKVHSLTGRITQDRVYEAFRSVKQNRGAAGIDKVSITMFEANLKDNLAALTRDLKDGTFQPQPLRRVYIPKGPGTSKLRPLGIPAVRDRIAQEVVRGLLAPIYEPTFHEASYGYMPKRNCHQAIRRLLRYHEEGYRVVLDADIASFFDNLLHHVIMAALVAKVADGNILNLVKKFLTAGVMENGVFKPTTVGTPQGGVISPLLANMVLNYLDWQLADAGYRFVRYADDFVIVCSTTQQAQEALAYVQRVLKGLGLAISPEKTKITTYGKGYEFLGFFLSPRSRRMRDKSMQSFKAKVRDLTIRKHNLSQEVIMKLNQLIRGTASFFAASFATNRWLFQKLDSWVRMRLRCMKRKRKNYNDNHKIRVAYFRRKFGLLTLEEFCTERDRHGEALRVTPRRMAPCRT